MFYFLQKLLKFSCEKVSRLIDGLLCPHTVAV
jgi:hypothetical protein